MLLHILTETVAKDFDYSILTILALTIIFGAICGALIEKIKIPAITGYIIAGVILGPGLGFLKPEVISGLKVLSNIAIGFIAFSIGTELWIPKFRQSGKRIIIITIMQAIFASIFTFLFIIIFQQPIWLALILAAIATATAPAGIMMIVKRYKAKGELTDTLIPVVGIDDAIGIIVFGVCIAIAKSLSTGVAIDINNALIEPALEILLSIIFGILVGLVIGLISKFVISRYSANEKRSYFLEIILCTIFFSVTVSHMDFHIGDLHFTMSPILAPMLAGFVFTNMINKEVFKNQASAVDSFTPPLLIAFFTLAGAELDFKVLFNPNTLFLAVIYVVARSTGKILGSYTGALVTKSSKKIKKYLGMSLLPQGGIEIGLVIAAVAMLSEVPDGSTKGALVQTIVLAGILIFELIGPILTKIGLEKAGELYYKNPISEDLHF